MVVYFLPLPIEQKSETFVFSHKWSLCVKWEKSTFIIYRHEFFGCVENRNLYNRQLLSVTYWKSLKMTFFITSPKLFYRLKATT